jgi:hypothetical protein
MTPATPKMRDFAERLIAHESRQKGSSPKKLPVVFPICEKLRPHLMTLVGHAGFHALLTRALALGSAEIAWLRAVQVKEDCLLAGPEKLHTPLESDELFEGQVVLAAQLLGLLVAFIGENLTFRLVREIWPKVRLNGLDFGGGGKNEKTE